MANKTGNENLEIRRLHFLPSDLQIKPTFPERITFDQTMQLTLSLLHGLSVDGSVSVNAFPWNSLKVSTYGSGYTYYETLADTAPADYDPTLTVSATTGSFHRFDFLIETEDVEIRFYDDLRKTWLGDIPLVAGNHSIEFSSTACQIRKRDATAGTFTIVAYQ